MTLMRLNETQQKTLSLLRNEKATFAESNFQIFPLLMLLYCFMLLLIFRDLKRKYLLSKQWSHSIFIHFKVMFLCPFAFIFRRKFWDKVDTNTTKSSDFPINNAVVLSKNANELMLMRFSFVYNTVTPYMLRSVNMGRHHDDTIEGLKVFVMINARKQPLNKMCFCSNKLPDCEVEMLFLQII